METGHSLFLTIPKYFAVLKEFVIFKCLLCLPAFYECLEILQHLGKEVRALHLLRAIIFTDLVK